MGAETTVQAKEGLERFIGEFLGGYRYFGYWGYGIAGQKRVWSKSEVIDLIEKFNGVANCGLSISTYFDGIPYRLFIPIDFDGEISESLNDAVVAFNFLAAIDADMILSYTGGRGFHILVGLKPKPYQSSQVSAFVSWLKLLLNLKTIDERIRDPRRLIRIPGTYHLGKYKSKNGGYQLVYNGGLSTLIRYRKGKLLDLDEIVPFYTAPIELDINGKERERPIEHHDYPCVEYHLEHEPEPHHIIRYSYVAWLYANGISPQEIFMTLKRRYAHKWVDWNDRITAMQITHICKKGSYKPLSCASLQALGYCLGKECPYYVDFDEIKSIRCLRHGEM